MWLIISEWADLLCNMHSLPHQYSFSGLDPPADAIKRRLQIGDLIWLSYLLPSMYVFMHKMLALVNNTKIYFWHALMELGFITSQGQNMYIWKHTYLACILLIFSTKVLPVLKLPEILPTNCSSVFLGGLHAHKGLSGLQNKNYFGKFYKTQTLQYHQCCVRRRRGFLAS